MFLELWPIENFVILKKIRMKSFQQDISKTFFLELWPFENLGFLKLLARYLENCLS